MSTYFVFSGSALYCYSFTSKWDINTDLKKKSSFATVIFPFMEKRGCCCARLSTTMPENSSSCIWIYTHA